MCALGLLAACTSNTTTASGPASREVAAGTIYRGWTSQARQVELTVDRSRDLRFRIDWIATCSTDIEASRDLTGTMSSGPVRNANMDFDQVSPEKWGLAPPPLVPTLEIGPGGRFNTRFATFEPHTDGDRIDYEVDIDGSLDGNTMAGTFSLKAFRINGEATAHLGPALGVDAECETGPVEWTARRH